MMMDAVNFYTGSMASAGRAMPAMSGIARPSAFGSGLSGLGKRRIIHSNYRCIKTFSCERSAVTQHFDMEQASIEVSIIGDNTQNQLLRHSGKGRNPACHTTPRSGQGRIYGVVPLLKLLVVRSSKTITVRGELVEPLVARQYWPSTSSQETAFYSYTHQ